MKFSIESGKLLSIVLSANSVVERRQTLPILANFLLCLKEGNLIVTGTDLEVEVTLQVPVISQEGSFETTLPARKLLEVCRVSDESTTLDFDVSADKAVIRSGKAKFFLSPLPSMEFPTIDTGVEGVIIVLQQSKLKKLLDSSTFAMAQQDVRYYLNGMLFEVDAGKLKLVATDGHRMAVVNTEIENKTDAVSVVLPRKSVLELSRLLTNTEDSVELRLSEQHLVARIGKALFKSKLIVANFPDYRKVIPGNLDKSVKVNREIFKDALHRVAVFSNEKFRLVKISLGKDVLSLQTSNSERESAEDEVAINYLGPELEIGFNVSYLLDIVSALESKDIEIHLGDVGTGCLIEPGDEAGGQFVIMPMRL